MKKYLPAIAWALLILVLSSGPGVSLPESWWDLLAPDKIGHFIIYGVFTILLIRIDYSRAKGLPAFTNSWYWILLSAVYGILMEVMQFLFFPGRYFEVQDIIANIIGSIFGLFLFRYFVIKNP